MTTVYNVAADITPSDTINIPKVTTDGPTDGVYVGGAGVVAVVFENGDVINFTAVAGQILPVAAVRVNLTNTTATLLRALYVV